jgi:hypothetical protein
VTDAVRRGSLGWIVASLAERAEALELFQWAEPAEPRDELGIGSLRDALANAFFPGTTTLQRGAKYFLFVPAMYARIESDRTLRRAPSDAIAGLENELLLGLLERHDSSQVIGGRFRRVPGTPPSEIYWTGLHTWGIRRFADSRGHYHAWLRAPARALRVEQMEEGSEQERVRWLEIPGLQMVLEQPRLELSRIEAMFLEDRVRTIKSKPAASVLAELLDEPPTHALSLWDTPLVRNGRASLTLHARDAERLSHAHHGAMLLYNLLCARQLDNRAAIEDWSDRCDRWSAAHPAEQWASWDLDAFWQRVSGLPDGARAMQRTRVFVTDLVAALARLRGHGLRGSDALKRVVRSRERTTKPGRERLSAPYALQGWKPSGLGVEPLDFRWRRASGIIADIQKGKERR